jgi:MFS family permease
MHQPDRVSFRSVGVALGSVSGNAVSSTAIINGPFSVFLLPVSASLGWTRSGFSAVLLVLAAIGLVSYAFFGRIADRYGARKTLIIGNLIFAATIAALSRASPVPAVTYALFILAGLAGSIPSTVVIAKIVADWFDRWRGMVFALTATFGLSIGYMLLPIFGQWMIDSFGWRGAYLGFSAFILLVGQPTFWFLLKNRTGPTAVADTENSASADAGTGTGTGGYTAAEARRSPVFWMILTAVCMGGLGFSAVTTHLVAMSIDRGMPPRGALIGISAVAASNLIFQGILGRLYDRLPSPRICVPAVLVMAVGLVVIVNARVTGMFILGGVLIGVGAGADYSFLPYSLQRYFGLKAYGEIYGTAFGCNLFIVSGGPLLLALSHDYLGSYNIGLVAIVVMFIASAIIMFRLPPYARIQIAAGSHPSAPRPAADVISTTMRN